MSHVGRAVHTYLIWLPRRRGTDRDSRGAMSHHEAAALDVPTLVAKYVYPGRFLMTNELFLDIR